MFRARVPAIMTFRLACLAGIAAVLAVLTIAAVPASAQSMQTGRQSALPIPRFVSLKSDAVNVRRGPSREHEVVWRYVRTGLPVEVTQEFENWRRIRDFEGAEGWVFHSLLSGTRTALVAPWDKSGRTYEVRSEAKGDAPVVARLEPGVQATIPACKDGWCRLRGQGFAGWMEQGTLWGVYQDENFN
jgi:SH3-like domain-containing protein